jgi:hypothetical protein
VEIISPISLAIRVVNNYHRTKRSKKDDKIKPRFVPCQGDRIHIMESKQKSSGFDKKQQKTKRPCYTTTNSHDPVSNTGQPNPPQVQFSLVQPHETTCHHHRSILTCTHQYLQVRRCTPGRHLHLLAHLLQTLGVCNQFF